MSLVKLKIESFKDAACTKKISNVTAMVNPENYSQDYVIRYGNLETLNNKEPTKSFARVDEFKLSFKKLLVDGTGIIPLPNGSKTVDDYISRFKSVVSRYNGEIHQPPFLKVTWGKLMFKGVCTSLKVDYSLFNPDGTALRAFIDIDISQTTDPSTKTVTAPTNSPDMSHIRTVNAGDTLPLMTDSIYNDSSYYLSVAKKNNLNSIYAVSPGDKIMFPPIKK